MPVSAAEVLQEWRQTIEADPEITSGIGSVYRWHITNPEAGEQQWTLCCHPQPYLEPASDKDPPFDCEIKINCDDLVDLALDRLNPQRAFLDGRLRLAGDLAGILRLNLVLDRLLKAGKLQERSK